MKSSTVLIKKYGNRRLYDTSASRYVNLDDVAALIRQGCDVQVTDVKTGEDLTRVTLTQIIVEDAKGQPAGLPLELLRQLIMASDRARQDFLSWYLHTAFDAYQKVQETLQSRLSDVSSVALGPLQRMRTFLAGALAPEQGAAVPPQLDLEEVEQLRRRVAELEMEISNGRSRKRSPGPKSKRPNKRAGSQAPLPE